MATATVNVSGIKALRYVLTGNTTFYFTGAVDGQELILTLQQDSTGSRTVTSGNCPGIIQPAAAAGSDTTMKMVYDAYSNAWVSLVQALSPGAAIAQTYTTSTTINWARGAYLFSSSATFNLTITNPVAGPPGVGNDGEIMTFCTLSAKTNGVTMGTTQTINNSSTSCAMAGAIGNSFSFQAWGGKVYLVAASGAVTLS